MSRDFKTPTRPDDLAARYRDLQNELCNLVEKQGSFPPEEMARHAREGSIKLYDALILAELIQELKPRRILEIGAFIGFSTRWLLEMSRAENTAVTSIDPNIRHRVFDRPAEILCQFNSEFLASRLVQKCGFFGQKISGDYYYDYEHYQPLVPRSEVDRLLSSRPVLNADNLDEAPFNFVFIDGDHCEEAVMNNFAEALKLLEPRGCIALHDAITWPAVQRAMERIDAEYASLGKLQIMGRENLQRGFDGLCDGIGIFRLNYETSPFSSRWGFEHASH